MESFIAYTFLNFAVTLSQIMRKIEKIYFVCCLR